MENRWIWPFELEEQIGAGGMGVVYRARFVKNDRRVALKLLPAEIAANPVVSARFERELEILKDLRHPGIVHCFGGTCEGEQHFYAMELVEGGNIQSLLKERGRLSWELVIEYAMQVCSALAYAHSRGIIHRDVKPGNLLLTKGDKVKLSDFGLALAPVGHKLTSAGRTLGTILYMAPEQIRGNPPLSNKTDLYALGCTMFEMLTGQPPFNADSTAAILHQHLQDPPPHVATLALDCPPELDSIVFDLMQKDPPDRPADASVVAQRLQKISHMIHARMPSKRIDLNAELTRAVRVRRDEPEAGPGAFSSIFRGNFLLKLLIALLLVGIAWVIPSAGQRGLYSRSEAQWVAALNHSDAVVRIIAAKSLGEIGPGAKAAVPALIKTLNDVDPLVRTEALRALGNMGSEAKPAMAAIVRAQKQDAQPVVRVEAEKALKQIHDVRSSSPSTFVLGLLVAAALIGGGILYVRSRNGPANAEP